MIRRLPLAGTVAVLGFCFVHADEPDIGKLPAASKAPRKIMRRTICTPGVLHKAAPDCAAREGIQNQWVPGMIFYNRIGDEYSGLIFGAVTDARCAIRAEGAP